MLLTKYLLHECPLCNEETHLEAAPLFPSPQKPAGQPCSLPTPPPADSLCWASPLYSLGLGHCKHLGPGWSPAPGCRQGCAQLGIAAHAARCTGETHVLTADLRPLLNSGRGVQVFLFKKKGKLSFSMLSASGGYRGARWCPKTPPHPSQPLPEGSLLSPWGAQLLSPACPWLPSLLLLLCFFLPLLV